MHIGPVDPNLDQLREWHDVVATAWAADHPDLPHDPFEELVGDVTTERSDARQERWLLRDGGTAVGASRLHLPQLDNTDNAELLLVVHPAYRRRGAGRTLLAHAADRARSQGRRRLVGEVFAPLSGSAPGPGFAAAVGAARALDELCRALRLDELDEARLTALDAEARSRAAGYDLVQWVGAAPAELVDDFAVLLGRMSTDAPLGDLAWEAEKWDAGRVREQEELTERKRRQRLVTAVRHEASGRLVAFSDLAYSTLQPETAYQWDTIVLAEHRGHRLGMLAKVANLRLLRREMPGARRLLTWNADSNAHMVAINEALGFRPLERCAEWQLEIG